MFSCSNFPSAPENVALAAQLDGQIQSLFDLGCGEAVDLGAVGAACAVHEPGVSEHVGRAPEALYAGALPLFENVVADLVQAGVGDVDVGVLGNQIHVVETEVADAQLLHKFKAGVYLCFGVLHGAGDGSEALVGGGNAEHIGSGSA